MINSKAKQTIENNPLAFATVNKNGSPNVIAVAWVKVVSDNQILVTDNFMVKTKENLQNDGNVCLAVWDKGWNGYKIMGVAEYFLEGKYKKVIENLEENKNLSAKGAIIITVKEISKLN